MIEQHQPAWKPGVNTGALEGLVSSYKGYTDIRIQPSIKNMISDLKKP